MPIFDGPDQLYLVRHGETHSNRERRFQGQLDVPLSPAGHEQAVALGRWLADRPARFDALYSSDLRRAAQTAETVGAHLGLTPILTPALREIDCGEWQGLTGAEIEARFRAGYRRGTMRSIPSVCPAAKACATWSAASWPSTRTQ